MKKTIIILSSIISFIFTNPFTEFDKDFLYTNVYNHPNIYKKKNEAKKIIMKLFEYFINNFNSLPDDWLLLEKNEKKHRIICDYISGMTDRYVFKLYESIYE